MPVIAARWPVVALSLLTLLLSLPLFAPYSWWPFGFVVFTPWLVAICGSPRARWVYPTSALLGAGYFLIHLRWLYSTTPEGYVAAALLWLAPGFLIGAWLIRRLYFGTRLGLVLVFPVAWVCVELLRSRTPLAFPWFLLGHSQIRLLSMVQIADLAGVLGISFVVAMVNGWLADLLLWKLSLRRSPKGTALAGSERNRRRTAAHEDSAPGNPQARRIEPWSTVTMVALLGITILYGWFRLGQRPTHPGPTVAVLQGDFELKPYSDPNTPTDVDKRKTYMSLLEQAAQQSPDLTVLPETPWSMYVNRELRELVNDRELLKKMSESRRRRATALSRWALGGNLEWVKLSRQYETTIVVGALSEEPRPDDEYPKELRYNSAFVYAPDQDEPARYDKIHLVPFGEYIPFRYSKNFFWLYRFLNDGPWNPFGFVDAEGNRYEHSLNAGAEFRTFNATAKSLDNATFRFAITICYEDVIPQVFRRFVSPHDGDKPVDFMLNISNDGWFGHGNQQAQHLVNCAFRAVENRVGIARAVNTGISGFIDSNGVWRNLVQPPGGHLQSGGTGFELARIAVDPRVTLYSRYGDVFAWICVLAAVTILVRTWLRTRGHNASPQKQETI